LLFADVAAWAAMGATHAVDFERAEARLAAAEGRLAALGTSNSSVLMARGVLAIFRGEPEQTRAHAQTMVDLTRASNDRYGLILALLMLALALQWVEPDSVTAPLDEAIRLARDHGIASALSIGLPLLAGSLADDESDRALALLDEAIEVGRRMGDRLGAASATADKGHSRSDAVNGQWLCGRPATEPSKHSSLEALSPFSWTASIWQLPR
jgi:hypothetical protein